VRQGDLERARHRSPGVGSVMYVQGRGLGEACVGGLGQRGGNR
jgi:hypothetical protein